MPNFLGGTCMNEEQLRILTETTERSKSNTHRIDKLEQQYELLHEMNNNLSKIAEQTKHTTEDVKCLKSDMEDIKSKPNKFLDNLKSVAAGAILTAIIGAVLALVL